MGKVLKLQKQKTDDDRVHTELSNALAIDLGEALTDMRSYLTANNKTKPQPYKVWIQTSDATYTWQSRATVLKYNPEDDTVEIVSQHQSEHPPMACRDIAECLMALVYNRRNFTITTNQWGLTLDQAKYERIIGDLYK